MVHRKCNWSLLIRSDSRDKGNKLPFAFKDLPKCTVLFFLKAVPFALTVWVNSGKPAAVMLMRVMSLLGEECSPWCLASKKDLPAAVPLTLKGPMKFCCLELR